MKTIDTSIDIAASPARVWTILADVARWAEWNPFVRSFVGPLEVGARVAVAIGPPGRASTTFRPRVLVADAEHGIRWLGRLGLPGLFDGEHHIALEALADGGTRVHHGEQFRGLLVPLLGGVLRDAEKGFVAMNQALKSRAEAAPAPTPIS